MKNGEMTLHSGLSTFLIWTATFPPIQLTVFTYLNWWDMLEFVLSAQIFGSFDTAYEFVLDTLKSIWAKFGAFFQSLTIFPSKQSTWRHVKIPAHPHDFAAPLPKFLPYMGYIGMCRCEGYSFQTDIQSNLSLRTPPYYGQFVWSQKCQKSYISYLSL